MLPALNARNRPCTFYLARVHGSETRTSITCEHPMTLARLRLGLTLSALHAATGVDVATLSKIAHGHIRPGPSRRKRIATVLGSSEADLFAQATCTNERCRICACARGTKREPRPRKLRPAQVADIKAQAILGEMTHRELAERYGVDESHVSRIGNGQAWKHIAPAPIPAPASLGTIRNTELDPF
jgi:DNA-binding Xre family transcriptional regulator